MSADSRKLIGAGLCACSIVLSAAGQLFMKAGMQELHHTVDTAVTSAGPLSLFGSIGWTAAGLMFYAVSLLTWLAVLVRYPLSLAYPLLSLSYILVYIGATHWTRLLEQATPLRTAGTLLILIGVALVSTTHKSGDRDSATQ